jgi:hypothetical protein
LGLSTLFGLVSGCSPLMRLSEVAATLRVRFVRREPIRGRVCSDEAAQKSQRTKEIHVDQIFQPILPAAPPPVEPAAVESRPLGLRRIVLTGAISALLLVGGGVAAVSAASPAPSTAPNTTAPSGNPGGTTPHTGSSVNCPNMGGSSGSGGSSSSGSSAPATTPAT